MVKDDSGELKAIEWEDTLNVVAKVLNDANGQVSIIIFNFIWQKNINFLPFFEVENY